MIICYVSDAIEYGRKKRGLSSAPLDMEYDNNSIEKKTLKPSPILTFLPVNYGQHHFPAV